VSGFENRNATIYSCRLVGTQPQSQTASGEVRLDYKANAVNVKIRDLVDPSYFGRDLTTGGTFNLFDVWLSNSDTCTRICLGPLQKKGIYWRIEKKSPLSLDIFSDIIVTAEHDSCPNVSSGMVVMVGCFCGMKTN